VRAQGEDAGTLFEWLVAEDGGGWRHWRERVPAWAYPRDAERPKFAQLIIPTLDSVRYEHLLGLVFAAGGVRQPASPAPAACTSTPVLRACALICGHLAHDAVVLAFMVKVWIQQLGYCLLPSGMQQVAWVLGFSRCY
jgi:hypothetical protein